MKYQLIEEYFETKQFQRIVQDYFDTVLGKIIAENTTLSAKGLFQVNGKVKRDYYDMPYHIHILNGLIPALFVYEKYLQQKGWIGDVQTEVYLKIFILGFTFHDANKLLNTISTREKGDLEIAVANLDSHINKWAVTNFFPEFNTHKETVYYLALATENRTFVKAEDYPITVNNRNEIKTTQRELCHFADSLASVQNEQLESIEGLYKAISSCLDRISSIVGLPISYLKVRQNPHTLLSQNLLQIARKQLHNSDKKILYTTRDGFIFWGEDITTEEYESIKTTFSNGSSEDIDILKSINIDYQSCKFGFLDSIALNEEILDEIMTEKGNKFLALSPNSAEKINDFDAFVEFSKQVIEILSLPIDYDEKNGKLTLRFYEDANIDEDEAIFRKVYCLHKIQWLNSKNNKLWDKDFREFVQAKDSLSEKIEFKSKKDIITISSITDLVEFINLNVKTSNAILKTYLNFFKTDRLIQETDDIDEKIKELEQSIIKSFKSDKMDNLKEKFLNQYFECLGNSNLNFLENYSPCIPEKKKMCAFTGATATSVYEKAIAFGMRSNAFNNRTITSLGNAGTGTSNISGLFKEENLIRLKHFSDTHSNIIAYYDFFEINLSISKEIINSTLKAKNKDWLKGSKIEFEKNVAFDYNLGFQFTKIKESKKVTFTEATFWFVRDHINLLKELGVRSFITNVGANYQSHKEAFHYSGAPTFLKKLGWNKVRLGHENEVLEEMSLMWNFGKKRLTNTILKVSQNRNAYFQLYYTTNFNSERDKNNAETALNNFIVKYKNKFNMTITEELVQLAVKVDLANESGASETWLIRAATEYLRVFIKQGKTREDVIQKICGEINRKLRMHNPAPDAINEFASAVYDRLYLKDWNRKLPSINQEKVWIYQFAFLFAQESKVEKRRRKAIKLKAQLNEAKLELTEENVKKVLETKLKKYSNQYFETIKNL